MAEADETGEETCEVRTVEVLVDDKICDGETVEDVDEESQDAADLSEALDLLAEAQMQLKIFLAIVRSEVDEGSNGPTLQLKELESLTGDVDIFLDQWDFPGDEK